MTGGAAGIGQPMVAADWATAILPRSRREPLPGHDASAGDEPAHADRLLDRLAAVAPPADIPCRKRSRRRSVPIPCRCARCTSLASATF